MLYISPKVMNKISIFSREDFCKLNFTKSDSNSRTKLVENLISYWEQPILNYIEKEVHTKKNPGKKDKEIIQLLGTKNPNYLNLRDILDIMLDAYSPIDLMLIMTFTNRNRKPIGKKLGRSIDRDTYRGLKLVISEWDNQADNPIKNDFLQDFLSTYQFRTKIKKSLSLKDDILIDDIIKSCIISAKIQQVRRLRRQSNNLLLSDKILEDCYKLWLEIEKENHDKIPSHGIFETKFLDMGISMQFHLNNNRRLEYKSNSPDVSAPKGLELNFLGKKIDDIRRNSKDHIGAQAFYWWFLRIRYMSAKKLIDKRLQKEILREISEYKNSLNKEMREYFEEIEKQEKRNLSLTRENHLIHGFHELSNYLSGYYDSGNNTDSIQSANEKISGLMSILLGVSNETHSRKASNLTSIFVKTTKNTKPICLEFDKDTGRFVAINLVPKNKSSLINNCRNAIRNANSAIRYQQSTNDYKSLIHQLVILIQLIIKLHVNLSDQRIYRYKDYFKPHVWSSNRVDLEKELFDEISGSFVLILKNIKNLVVRLDEQRLGRLTTSRNHIVVTIINNWIEQIEKIPNKTYITESNKKVGRLGMFSKLLGTILDSNDGAINLNKTSIEKNSSDLDNYELNSEIALDLTKDDMNLKPIAAFSIY